MKMTTTPLKNTTILLLLLLTIQFSYAQLDSTHFVSTWLTSMQGSSNSQSITLFTDPNYNYNYDVDWDNDGVFEDTNVLGNITHQYPTAGRYTIRIKGIFPRIYFGDSTLSSWQTDRKKLLFIDQWGAIQWKNLAHAFNGCEFMSLRATDVPNLSQVKNMKYLFANINGTFNPSISNWDVSQVTNMEGVFNNAVTFNEPIDTWQVDSVKIMENMFYGATTFNQPIGGWNVSNVTNMLNMFQFATAFNQPIGNWDVVNVDKMYFMFKGATAFNQNLGDWDISSVSRAREMFDSSGMSTANYDSTLMGWQAKPHPANLTVGAANLSYCASDSVRNLLISNSGWTFVGDTLNCVTVGIEKQTNKASNFKVYPNPTQGQLTIESTAVNRNAPLLIYNIQGQKVRSIRLESKSQAIDLCDLLSGLYFVVQGKESQKLVIEK
jgi:surface protein